MYDHVCTCYQTSLHCTAHHHCTARLVFLIFLLETSTVNKETPFQSFHSLVEFSTNRSRHPWPLGQTRPLLTRCSQVHKLWTTPGRRGAAESEIHTATWRPGDLATWPAKRRAAPSEDEPGSTGSTTEKLPKVFFLPVSEIFCLNMFEIDMSITFHDFSILFISPLIWCNDCAATMSP